MESASVHRGFERRGEAKGDAVPIVAEARRDVAVERCRVKEPHRRLRAQSLTRLRPRLKATATPQRALNQPLSAVTVPRVLCIEDDRFEQDESSRPDPAVSDRQDRCCGPERVADDDHRLIVETRDVASERVSVEGPVSNRILGWVLVGTPMTGKIDADDAELECGREGAVARCAEAAGVDEDSTRRDVRSQLLLAEGSEDRHNRFSGYSWCSRGAQRVPSRR